MAHFNPEVKKFIDSVNATFCRGEIESFWNCQPSFTQLLAGEFVQELLNRELRQLAEDQDYVGDWQPKHMMIHRGSGYSLSLSLFDASQRYGYIHTIPYYGMYAAVGAAGLSFDRYALPQNYRNDLFDPSMQLSRAESRILAPGEVLLIHPERETYDFKVDEPVLVVKFTTAPVQPLEWLFSKETLFPWQANDSEVGSTQLRVAAYVLGRLAHPSSLEPLRQLTSHSHHAVRWAAIQSLGRLSRTAAIEKLEIAVTDRHPHVRQAAEKTLRQLTQKTAG